jgi:nicotinamide-nucleotide amidase
MRAQILSIGDELLGGYITDTNSTFLEQQLALLNIPVTLVTQVGDNRDRIAGVISRALEEADIVVCTGGVGPTEDDLTREAIAHVLGEEPVVDSGLLEVIRNFFANRGLEMPERNQKQAWVVPSCQPLPNPIGTAPGWYVRTGEHVIVAMPGVPREMFRMWSEQVLPRISMLRFDRVVRSTTLRTIGIGESMVEQTLDALVKRADPVIATYAKDDGVHVRITAVAETEAEATAKRDSCVSEVTERIGSYVYGLDDESLAGVLLGLLESLDLTISICDAGGGGRFASMIAANPGADALLINSSMQTTGSEGMAQHLAEAAAVSEANLGIGISVAYEPIGGGVYAAAVEVAVTGDRSSRKSFPIRTAYEDIQRRSALFAAEVLRSALISD